VPVIFLTNDDGFGAPGLVALENCVHDLGTIVVVAPDRERSAVSHGLTIRDPLDLVRVDEGRYTLTGTPADCVLYSLQRLVFPPPDLILSGINNGANLGDDIMYSGTVAAAREGARHGVTSIAISQAYGNSPVEFGHGMEYVRALIEAALAYKLAPGLCLNVNIPHKKVKGVQVTRQGTATHFPHFNKIAEDIDDDALPDLPERSRKVEVPTDYRAVSDRFISVTPLQRDQTDHSAIRTVGDRIAKVFPRSIFPGLGLIGRSK
jgi:5'-nucleotidase